ncbi:MAG TPA: ATP-binding protein [Desulfomonilia bacterium]|nr:ATP-binding protein [Desulfomonilia bacterium]
MKNGPIRLGILIPVPGCGQPEKTTMGYMLLEIDPTAFLFPLIQSWPTPSHTAETLLVRREGNDVLFLNELRHIKKTVLRLRLPLYRHDLPAARAVLGYEGAMEGDDYRGKAVLAYLDKIPDSPWFMVSKVDQDEIYAPIQKVALSITVIVILMILGSGSFIFVWYRGRQAEIYRRQLELERERTALAERVNLLTRHANDIIFMLDQDWLILEANDRALEAYGYSLEELRHKHLYELRLPGPREEFEPQIEPIKSKGSAVFETTHQRKDGTVFPVESSVRMVEIGGMEFIMDIVRDITERKKAEEEVKKVLADLERSNKELEQFAYVASHDLQEPLRMVSSFTQLLARRYGDKLDQDAKDFINYAVNGANRMQRLIQDLLTYSRVSTRGGSPAPTDTGSALDEVLANLHVSIMESGALVTNDEMPVVTADRSQLVQVFQNLVGNAIKFRSDDPPRIHISAEKSGDEWIFSVEDNGIGMEPQYFDRVFALFQRLHAGEKYQGTGIGLALCKRVIQRLGGRIWVESRHGEGSTFYFTLKGVEQ